MPPSAWRFIPASFPEVESGRILFVISNLKIQILHFDLKRRRIRNSGRTVACETTHAKRRMRNDDVSARGLLIACPRHLPESRIGFRERDPSLNRPAVPIAKKDHAAILLLMRHRVGNQQFLPLLDRSAEQQQRAIRAYLQRVRLFMKCFSARRMPVNIYANVYRPPPAAPPVGNLHRARPGRRRRQFAGTRLFRMLDRFEDSTHRIWR